MAVQYGAPIPRRVVFYLDGTQNRFFLTLKSPIKESVSIALRSFTAVGVPLTGIVPNSPILRLRFQNTGGFTVNQSFSNASDTDEIVLTMDAAVTKTTYAPAMLIGTARGGLRQEFLINVASITGAPHEASTNKLFDYLVLELDVMETRLITNPNWLQQVPSIQQTLDSV